jgi:plastocyanin
MATPNEETTDEPTDRSTPTWPGFERRPLLKALGVGTALSLGGGVATAYGDKEDENDKDDEGDEAAIDPRYGLPAPDAENIPEGIEPDHVVELHTDLPADFENPDHPPFFHFEPSGIQVKSNDVVQFTLEAPDHTITAYHPAFGFQQRVPDNVPPFSSPVMNVGGAWLYEFVEPGVYDLYCGPHHVLGMNMRIVVGELADEDVPDYVDTFEGSQDPPLLAPFSKAFLEHELNATNEANEDCVWSWMTPQEILGAPSLDPSTIQEQGSVSFEAVLGDIDRFPDEVPEHDG